jgi:hypothetical protein
LGSEYNRDVETSNLLKSHPRWRLVAESSSFQDRQNIPELISPELVLVDPELARSARALLLDEAPAEASTDLATLPRDLEQPPPEPFRPHARGRRGRRNPFTRLRQQVVPVLATISVMAGAVLIGLVISQTRSSQSPPAVSPMTPPTAPAVARKKSAALERKILALLVHSPTGKLPPSLIDGTTGLAKNNLHAVCRPRKAGSFLCTVRPARQMRWKGLTVLYRPGPGGRGVFTWYPRSQ